MYIRMIGEFEVRSEAGHELTPRGAKSRALLALLARTPGHRRPRRWLEARLWSDRGQEQASGSLRQALTELRKALGPLADHLTSDRDCVALSGLRTDLDADPAGAAARLAQGREFLEGIDVIDPAFNLWLAEERQRVAAELGRATVAPVAAVPFSLRLGELPEGTEATLARDLAAAIARLTAEYLLGEGQRGGSGELLPRGLNLLVEGDWSEDRAYLKVRLVDQVNHRTLWSQRLTASRKASGRGELAPVLFEATDGQLM
ncbi:AfsR/SARP family transcriptional regulator [Phormidesmis sp. 146-33]